MTRQTTTPSGAPDVPGPPAPEAHPRDEHDEHDEHDRRLLRGARAGDPGAVASLYDRHAGALYAFARGVLRDGTAAEDAVVDVMVEACGPPRTDRPRPRSVRHELAVATYRRCEAPRPLGSEARSRAVLGLCLHGDHTHREAAALTGVAGSSLGRLLQDELSDRGLPLTA